jgi:diguanylate cyclase (GGDEF)-like protein
VRYIKRVRILIVDTAGRLGDRMADLMREKGYVAYRIDNYQNALVSIYNEPPDLLLLDCKEPGWEILLKEIKKDAVYGHLPVIAFIDMDQTFDEYHPNDFIVMGFSDNELVKRIELTLMHAHSNLDANPLTHLPGNYAINQCVQQKLAAREPFAMAYVDIDNFKSFNDKYGFSRGDEALRMAGRILANVVRRITDNKGFVGHVGGDDFVFVVLEELVEQACQEVIRQFDSISPTLYDENDRACGSIISVDRQGTPCTFPLMSVSIAVVFPTRRQLRHPGEAAAIAGELKKRIKKKEGSHYMLDQRTGPANLQHYDRWSYGQS